MSKSWKPSFRSTVCLGTILMFVVWFGVHVSYSNKPKLTKPKDAIVPGFEAANDDKVRLQEAAIMARYPDFDWKAYLELNPDLAKHFHSEPETIRHFVLNGIKEQRLYRVIPDGGTWKSTMVTMRRSLRKLDKMEVPIQRRTLIIYHLGTANQNNSLDVSINNMKMFVGALLRHSPDATQQAVYLFNVEGGVDNPLLSMIPIMPNVAVVHWDKVSSDMITHIRTIKNLGEDIVNQFSALLFFNQGVRGPLTHRNDGEWLNEFRRLLDNNNVGMVGSTISCEITPHVQTHVFAIKSQLFLKIVDIIDRGPRASTWLEIIAQYEVGLTTALMKEGYNVSALLYDKRLQKPYFDGTCINQTKVPLNPTSWCDINPNEVIFMKWGGEPLRTLGYMCDEAIATMQNTLEKIASAEPSLGLVLPEVLAGGRLYDLYKEFAYETYVDRRGSLLTYKNQLQQVVYPNGGPVTTFTNPVEDAVCFLVRTYDSSKSGQKSINIEYDLADLIQSLLRQTSPHWIATIFNTDIRSDYDRKLKKLIADYSDSRIRFLDVPDESRPQFTTIDAGYTATDYVLKTLESRTECKWISVTNSDNIYGSSVVANVRAAKSSYSKLVDAGSYTGDINMILNPVDSRNFADQDYVLRNEVTKFDDRCVSIFAQLHLNRLAFTTQPIPVPGGMDLASVFFNRNKLVQEALLFSNFTNIKKYPCAGCQDGYFTEYLVRNRLWNYVRLPIDGLRSIVFHGPSPTWCIASGNVWFDHPRVGKVGCYTHNTVMKLIYNKTIGGQYDAATYFHDRICLRLSNHGFNKEMGY